MKVFITFLALVTCWMGAAQAASSFDHRSDMLTARLITAEDGVAPDASTISAGLVIDLEDGWKTYWKSPGQVGYPPTVNWDASDNVADVDFQWPAPKRFVAFDIENYGYADTVTHPLKVTLSTPGAPVTLRGSVSLLVCSDVCVPQEFDVALSVPEGRGIDMASADIIAKAADAVPTTPTRAGLYITAATLSPDRSLFRVSFDSDTPLTDPHVFVDMGPEAAFGAPDVALSGTSAVVTLPVLSLPEVLPTPEVTITDGTRAAVARPQMTTGTVQSASAALGWTLILAFIGGLILNVMPCVLPVLSIKFASAMKSADQSLPRIRAGFLVSALGVLSFMWALAFVLIALRATGGQVGWGIQFQSPLFLSLMIVIMTVFAANLAGAFEINLPQSWTTSLARKGDGPGLGGDFATGALAAVMATPCSAPFLGTAVTVALAGSALDTMAIFTALGAGLSLPYFLVALHPGIVKRLPKPGAWMNVVKLILAAMMAVTGVWLLTVLASITGPLGAGLVIAGAAIAVAAFSMSLATPLKSLALLTPLVAIIIASQLTVPTAPSQDTTWTTFDREAVVVAVANGATVFVDVTAAWCLTCKANKTLVLDRGAVKAKLASDEVLALRADWTRPDPSVLAYLQDNGRFGIPFNIVYGPDAPDGIALPEILTSDAVLTALEQAGG